MVRETFANAIRDVDLVLDRFLFMRLKPGR